MLYGWQKELGWVALFSALALGIGWLIGHILIVLGLFLLGYLLRHLVSLHRLQKQLVSGTNDHVPNGSGVWEEIYYQLHQLRRRSKRRKKRLVRMIGRFRNAFAALPDAIVFLGEDDEIQWFNSASEELLGLKKSDQGLLIGNLIRSPKFFDFLRENSSGNSLTIASPCDSNLMLEIRLVPYGEDIRLLLAQNVTQLRFMERVRSDFVANVSHELRTPLTVLKGYLENLTDANDPALARYGKALSSMEEQTGRMQRLIEDLLSLTRLESTPQNLLHKHKTVNVVALLQDICNDVNRLSEMQAPITLRLQSGLALLGDEQELRSAFSNLIINAVKYTPTSGAIDVIWCDEDDGARLDVRDTGEGIAETHIPRLTERFYRVESATRGKVGVGLGLAIVKHVLLRHDAELKITSKLGQGSCFSCCFPAKRVRSAELTTHDPTRPS